MKAIRWLAFTAAVIGVIATMSPASTGGDRPKLVFACKAGNDLFQVLTSCGVICPRCDSPAEAIRTAPEGSGVLLLADGYPATPTTVDGDLFRTARQKRLRVYVEFPALVPGIELGTPRGVQWERAVVASEAFGPELPPMRILAIHDCRFMPLKGRDQNESGNSNGPLAAGDRFRSVTRPKADHAHLVMARVAGYDRAVFGLPKETFPILVEHSGGELLVATTKLSQFVTARYAPTEAWTEVWRMILGWLDPACPAPRLRWTPAVRPSYARDEILKPEATLEAIRRGTRWYDRARLVVGDLSLQQQALSPMPSNEAGVFPAPPPNVPPGDGRLGILEGHSSRIASDGSQPVRWFLRNDCNSESAMAMALDALVDHDQRSRMVAANAMDFVYFHSNLQQGPRADPASPSYGLVGWFAGPHGSGIYYGDDNARAILATMAVAAVSGSDRWDESMLRAILGNFRTTGKSGFRGSCLQEKELQQRGWQHFYRRDLVNPAPHYESWIWACYLWLYDKTRYEPLLDRARTGIRLTMDRYPAGWQWTNGQKQIERARMLLPLAWLVRVEDTPEHRAWLGRIADDLLARQDASGALQEEISSSLGSNAEYGTCETSLLQQNGDPVADMLYTCNFALISLNEAAAATGEVRFSQAVDRLAEFLVRIQIRSEARPELDGAWFRGFDFRRWEYWGSNGDSGWGAWCTETGWSQGCIVAGLALRQSHRNLWQLTAQSRIATHFARLRPQMLP